jgi:hypothetical protein
MPGKYGSVASMFNDVQPLVLFKQFGHIEGFPRATIFRIDIKNFQPEPERFGAFSSSQHNDGQAQKRGNILGVDIVGSLEITVGTAEVAGIETRKAQQAMISMILPVEEYLGAQQGDNLGVFPRREEHLRFC